MQGCQGHCRVLVTTRGPIDLPAIDGAALRKRRRRWFREGLGWLLRPAEPEPHSQLALAAPAAPPPPLLTQEIFVTPLETPEPPHKAMSFSLQPDAPSQTPVTQTPQTDLRLIPVSNGFVVIVGGNLHAVAMTPADVGRVVTEWAGG